ncbi:MAG TPA: cupin domain-containing protein [Acidimicrobiales bacterium]
MAVLTAGEATTHELFGVRFTGLASPSRGSTELMAWQTEIPPGTPATPHQVTREELVVILAGRAEVRLGDDVTPAGVGDVVVVPPDTDFTLHNVGDEPLRVVACMPTGGQARIEGEARTLPWMR